MSSSASSVRLTLGALPTLAFWFGNENPNAPHNLLFVLQTCNNDRQDRDRLIQALGAKHGIPLEGASPFSDQAASAFSDKARQQLEELQRSLLQMKVSEQTNDKDLTMSSTEI